MISEVRRIQTRSGLDSRQMARLLGISIRMLASWKAGGAITKTTERRLRLLDQTVDSYGDQPPERVRYLLFAPKCGVSDYDRIRRTSERKPVNGPAIPVRMYLG